MSAQPESPAVVEVVSDLDARTLAVVLDVLKRIEDNARSAAWDTPSHISAGRDVYAQDYGRLAEAASIAGDVVFNVLNTASNFCYQEPAKAAMQARFDAARARSAEDGA